MYEKVIRKLMMGAADALWCVASLYISFYLTMGSHLDWPYNIANIFYNIMIVTVILMWVVNIFGKLYKIRWEFASIREMLRVVTVIAVYAVLLIVIGRIFAKQVLIRLYPIFVVIYGIGIMTIRLSYRLMRYLQAEYIRSRGGEGGRILIVGAGEAGRLLLLEVTRNPERGSVLGFIDDDKDKEGTSVRGIRVLGTTEQIPEICENTDATEIMIALPSESSITLKRILNICTRTTCKILIMPSINEMTHSAQAVTQLRSVEPEDLLGRAPVDLDVESISGYLSQKTVLVTGAGGSIGSELCRQIAGYNPKCLVLLDIYENSVFELRHELRRRFVEQEIEVVIASVRDRARMDVVFNRFRPEIVFHAAAHKHVPLMEFSPGEAVKNNIFGTLNVAEMADKHGAERFVMISTDKAVNPTNVMGATKRVAEMVVNAVNAKSATEYTAVRFGNVLGSNGSVIPLFKKQIEAGGPVTVTHPDITRYFMTIPEAAQLVLQAGGLIDKGGLFVLDMGEMVKIDDLARNLIRLSGLVPGQDIKIVYTGLRPGEKMYEELLLNREELQDTPYKKIFIAKADFYEYDHLMKQLNELRELLDGDDGKIVEALRRMVPEFGIEHAAPAEEEKEPVKIYRMKNRQKADGAV